MRSWLVLLSSTVIFLAVACGDATETTAPTQQALTLDCAEPLLASPVAFSGPVVRWVGSGSTGNGYVDQTVRQWTKVDVRVERIRVAPEARRWRYNYVPGETITVVVLGPDPVQVRSGACVAVSGDVSRWACGPGCDAAGFVADEFRVLR